AARERDDLWTLGELEQLADGGGLSDARGPCAGDGVENVHGSSSSSRATDTNVSSFTEASTTVVSVRVSPGTCRRTRTKRSSSVRVFLVRTLSRYESRPAMRWASKISGRSSIRFAKPVLSVLSVFPPAV